MFNIEYSLFNVDTIHYSIFTIASKAHEWIEC